MYYTIRLKYYWPQMAKEIYGVVNNSLECCWTRRNLKLFPARGPSELLPVDMLGLLQKISNGNQFFIFMNDRNSKLTCVVTLSKTTALHIALMFINNWIRPYSITNFHARQ